MHITVRTCAPPATWDQHWDQRAAAAKQVRAPLRFAVVSHDPLPLPAYRSDRLAFAPHTAGLWPDCSIYRGDRGILLLAGLALWIVKSVFVWWRERQDTKKWWGQYEAETNAWDKRRELESSHESEDNARRR